MEATAPRLDYTTKPLVDFTEWVAGDAVTVSYGWIEFVVEKDMIFLRTACCGDGFYGGRNDLQETFTEAICLSCERPTGFGFEPAGFYSDELRWPDAFDWLSLALSYSTDPLEATLGASMIVAELEDARSKLQERKAP